MKKYERLFVFGCSFTAHSWPTYANIIAYEYDIPFYNYGCGGAGNQYIFWSLMQADSFYNFSEHDLVIIEWTNVSREDRYKNGKWLTPGNIYSQGVYDDKFVENYADHVFFGIRDFAAIKASIEFLNTKKCNYHLIKMCEFDILDQWNNLLTPKKYIDLCNLYKPYLEKIHPSFYKILWNNDIKHKLQQEKIDIGEYMNDGHPFIIEHLQYIQNVLNFNPSEKTKTIVYTSHNKIIEILKQENKKNKNIEVWNLNWSDVYFNQSQKIQRI